MNVRELTDWVLFAYLFVITLVVRVHRLDILDLAGRHPHTGGDHGCHDRSL